MQAHGEASKQTAQSHPRVGYARCDTDEQGVAVQTGQFPHARRPEDRSYLDRGLARTSAPAKAWHWPRRTASNRAPEHACRAIRRRYAEGEVSLAGLAP